MCYLTDSLKNSSIDDLGETVLPGISDGHLGHCISAFNIKNLPPLPNLLRFHPDLPLPPILDIWILINNYMIISHIQNVRDTKTLRDHLFQHSHFYNRWEGRPRVVEVPSDTLAFICRHRARRTPCGISHHVSWLLPFMSWAVTWIQSHYMWNHSHKAYPSGPLMKQPIIKQLRKSHPLFSQMFLKQFLLKANQMKRKYPVISFKIEIFVIVLIPSVSAALWYISWSRAAEWKPLKRQIFKRDSWTNSHTFKFI